MTLLRLDDVVTGYESAPVLKGIDLEVENDEVVGIIGPNGAGKSTVLKTIMGYLEPWEGQIRYMNDDIGGIRPSRLVDIGVGYVPQIENVFPRMTVMENIRMGAFTLDDDLFHERIDDLFALFPRLEERKQQKVYTMSGGEQKMVAVARATIMEPDLVLFDEPSAGLMPKYVDDVFQKARHIQEERTTSFLIIEQNVQRVLENTDRTYVIRDGRVHHEDASENLLNNDDLKQVYLGGKQGADA